MSTEAMKLAKAWFERNTYGDEAVDVYEALCEALAQPQQEPVAWMNAKRDMTYLYGPYNADDIPLYTSPPAQRKPLTDEEIRAIVREVDEEEGHIIHFARAIEAAHGIKGDAYLMAKRKSHEGCTI